MGLTREALIAASVFLFTSAFLGQEPYRRSDPTVIARLSYDVFGIVAPGKPAHVCFAVSSHRDYWIERLPQNGQMERRKGTLTNGEFGRLDQLLSTNEFRAVGGYHGGLIRQEVDSAGAWFLAARLGERGWRKSLSSVSFEGGRMDATFPT